MNTNQLSYVILDSAKNILAARETYGFYNSIEYKQLLILGIIKDILAEAEWYTLTEEDLVMVQVMVQNTLADLVLHSKHFLFDVPVTGIYSNFSDPQTSFTYDEIQ